jgi:predicted nucleotidyltransferase
MNRPSNISELLQKVRSLLPYLKEAYQVDTLQAFGSYVRGEEKATSDLDILVTFRETPSLLEFVALENYLSDNLGVKVDLVMKNSLKEPLQSTILAEAISLAGLVKLIPPDYQANEVDFGKAVGKEVW